MGATHEHAADPAVLSDVDHLLLGRPGENGDTIRARGESHDGVERFHMHGAIRAHDGKSPNRYGGELLDHPPLVRIRQFPRRGC